LLSTPNGIFPDSVLLSAFTRFRCAREREAVMLTDYTCKRVS